MSNSIIKTSFGDLDTSKAPIYADQFGDGSTYGLDMTIGGTTYKYVPKDIVKNGGVISGDNAYLFPWLANADNLKTFTSNASLVDLGDVGFANYLKNNNIGTQGYLVKADAVPFDSSVNTQPSSTLGGTLTGLKNNNGEIVIGLSGGGGSRYLNQAGEVHNPTTTYSSLFGDVFGGLGQGLADAFNEGLSAVNSLGPVGIAAISAVSPVAGAAISGANTGQAVGSGESLSNVLPSLAASYAGSQLGSAVGSDYGTAAGQLAGNTASGLLSGQDLGSSLTNAALATGANQAAGGLLSSASTPTATPAYTPTTDYTSGADYSLSPLGQSTGLQADLAPLDLSNPYSFDTTAASTGGLGLTQSTTPNLSSMGGAQGLTGVTATPTSGTTLGSIGATSEAATASGTNPSTQDFLSKLLLSAIAGQTGTNNMATTTANNNLLGGLLGGVTSAVGGLLQGNTTSQAQQAQADALRQAGQTAVASSQFRPVGTTTTFGTSNFQVDPTTGQLTSAGYTLSPALQAYQDQIMGANRQSLTDAANLQNLGRSYIGQNPNDVASQWYNQQQALLAPSRDVESARLANQLQQTGRTGVSVAQGGNLQAANPEQAALANARAMADAQMAANAQQYGQQQVNFGQGLLSSAYQPFNAGLTTASNVEQLGQQPLGLSSGLAQQSSASGARAGQLGLTANTAAANAALSNQYNPYATVLSGLGGSSLFNNAMGNVAGNTGLGGALGSWLQGLSPDQLNSAASGWMSQNSDITPASTYTGGGSSLLSPDLQSLLGL